MDGTPCFTVAAHYISVADVLLATGANDSSDWLRRNDSYTWTFCTRSNIARTDTDTMITGTMKWLLILAFHVIFIFFVMADDAATVSPGSARKQKKKERGSELGLQQCPLRKGPKGIPSKGKDTILRKVQVCQ